MNMKNVIIMIMEVKIGLQEPSLDMYVRRQDSIQIDRKKSNGNKGKTSWVKPQLRREICFKKIPPLGQFQINGMVFFLLTSKLKCGNV